VGSPSFLAILGQIRRPRSERPWRSCRGALPRLLAVAWSVKLDDDGENDATQVLAFFQGLTRTSLRLRRPVNYFEVKGRPGFGGFWLIMSRTVLG
jgi:hypothetical protein